MAAPTDEVGIRKMVATVVLADAEATPQLLIRCETYNAAGERVRTPAFPDWWPLVEPSQRAAIAALTATLTAKVLEVLDIPPPEPPEE